MISLCETMRRQLTNTLLQACTTFEPISNRLLLLDRLLDSVLIYVVRLQLGPQFCPKSIVVGEYELQFEDKQMSISTEPLLSHLPCVFLG